MKKIILVGLMAVSFNVSAEATYADYQASISKLCSGVAELVAKVVDRRDEGMPMEDILSRLTFLKKKSSMNSVVEQILRDAYYQGLDRDTAKTLAYSACSRKMPQAVQ